MTRCPRGTGSRWAAAFLCALLVAGTTSCRRAGSGPAQRTFSSPEDAANALDQAVKSGNLDAVKAIFGPDSAAIVDSSDPETARRNQGVFAAAFAERWRLEPQSGGAGRVLVIGNEEWPFPIPLVAEGKQWRFDTAAGREEILDRRIGRNEIAAIRICSTYVAAQRLYARSGHDGRQAGIYAAAFRSAPGTQSGLYWPAGRHEPRSPLGDLVAEAAAEGKPIGGAGAEPAPFHGYYFRILTAQGNAAPGGARTYLQNGGLSGGFALVAWPAHYDVTGVMTFIVNQDGVVHEKDLGPETDRTARQMAAYDPDPTWSPIR
jgi:hypothetical protein